MATWKQIVAEELKKDRRNGMKNASARYRREGGGGGSRTDYEREFESNPPFGGSNMLTWALLGGLIWYFGFRKKPAETTQPQP